MSRPIAAVLWAPGTNCHHETKRALARAGASATLKHMPLVEQGKERLTDCDLMVIPGGFSYGDHLAAGRVLATQLRSSFLDQLQELRVRKIPILGICNGLQVLTELGLLPGDGELGEPTAVLDVNLSAKFEHWQNTLVHFPETNSLWTKLVAGQSGAIPVAHGEGRPVLDPSSNATVAAVYGLDGTTEYPESPNGSSIAGISNADGAVCGMMPHPERVADAFSGSDFGLGIFRSGVEAVK